MKRRISKAYYQRHKEKCLARTREWAAKNPEKKAAAIKAWEERNRGWRLIYLRDYMRRRRAAEKSK